MNTKKSSQKKTSATSAKKTADKRIPPPPPADAPCEQLDAYVAKYSWEQLEKAGYMRELTKRENAWMNKLDKEAKRRIGVRQNRAQLNLALPAYQLLRFTRYAKRKHIPPSTLARSWILERLDQETKRV